MKFRSPALSAFEIQALVLRLWFEACLNSAQALAVIALRMPVLVGAAGRGPAEREARTMVSEKLVAAGLGALAGSREAVRRVAGATSAAGVVRAAAAIGRAAARPAEKRLSDNLRRLSRTRI